MTHIAKMLSPKSQSGSVFWSVAAHALIFGGAAAYLTLGGGKRADIEEYIDLGYEVLTEPPAPAEEVKRVARAPEPPAPVEPKSIPDDSPKEIQDEKSDVAGTQEAAKTNPTAGAESNGTAASTPYYKIKPKYPRAALVSGTEGWVLFEIDITEKGEVENIRIVDGEQRNLFQAEARRAVGQYRYRPFVDGQGNPIRKANHQVRVDFKLEEAGG
jgi:periplasmic protein TonB